MTSPELQTLNRQLAANPPNPAATVAESRRATEEAALHFPVPEGVQPRATELGAVPALWLDGPGAAPDRVVLYMHGGAYVIGSAQSFARLAAEVGIGAGSRCVSLDYRLAPEDPFPAAIDDVVSAYQALLRQGFAPGAVAFVGDSAGGGLALASLLACRERGLPLPACAAALSPWLDLELTGPSMQTRGALDLVLSQQRLAQRAAHYLAGASPRDPLASPIYADLTGLPPILLQASTAELLLDDAVRFAARASSAHVRVTLDLWPELPHDWHRFSAVLPQAREALAMAGQFLARHLQAQPAAARP